MTPDPRARAAAIAREAVLSLDPRTLVRDALPALPPPRARVTAIAIGKAAPAMMRGALDRWPGRIARAIVVTTDGTSADFDDAPLAVEVLRGAHPLPDARSVLAAETVLAAAAGGSSSDVCLALVSGGASSLASAPVGGVSSDELRALVAEMLAAGAPIADVNVVRRHLSRIHGGGLARAALPGRTLAMILSDVLVDTPAGVVPGAPHDVGSGPAIADPTTVDQARAALTRWAPRHLVGVEPRWTTPLASTHPDARRARARIVASPLDLALAAASRATAAGHRVRTLGPSLDPIERLADEYVALAATLAPGDVCVRVAEPSVRLPVAPGRGGRAGRLALMTWCRGLPADVALVCLASDGVDGSSGSAGGSVSGSAPSGATQALEAFDDGPFLAAHDASLSLGPTGRNLLDVHVLLRAR